MKKTLERLSKKSLKHVAALSLMLAVNYAHGMCFIVFGQRKFPDELKNYRKY